MSDADVLSTAVGRRARELRDQAGATQSDVIAIAFKYGFRWAQSAWANIENGKRNLTALEFTVLPLILTDLTGQPVGLGDLVPRETVWQHLLPGVLHGLASGERYELRLTDEAGELLPQSDSSVRFSRSEAMTDKVAWTLGVEPKRVTKHAGLLWGHDVLAERLRREEQAEVLDRDERSRQAVRGHITRALLDELRESMKLPPYDRQEG